ncbi:MAG: PAS domain-containing protein [Rhodospirillales bacterium]|nr:PAS domain-containing protein [Rhodospirillales bacterium]
MEFVKRVDNKKLKWLYGYWTGKRKTDRLPGRADIDPLEMGDLLPHLILAEVVPPDRRIRFRLVGTEMVINWGEDFTGRYIDDIMSGDYRAYIAGMFADAIRTRAAVYSESLFRWDQGRFRGAKRLYLPLASDGINVDMVLVGQVFEAGKTAALLPTKVLDIGTDIHEEVVRVFE